MDRVTPILMSNGLFCGAVQNVQDFSTQYTQKCALLASATCETLLNEHGEEIFDFQGTVRVFVIDGGGLEG